MAAGTEEVDITLGGDISPAKAALAELQSYGEKVQRDLNGAFARTLSAYALPTAAISGIGAVLGSTVEKMHEVHHESERFAVDAQFLQLIGNAAEQDGVSLEAVARGYNQFLLHLQDARNAIASGTDDTNKNVQALNSFGVSNQQIIALKPQDTFLKIADGVKTADDKTKAYADTAQLLGKRFGTEMIPTLEKGADGIKRVSDGMIIWSDATLEKGEIIHQFWERVKATITLIVGYVIGEGFKKVADFFLLWRTESTLTTDIVVGAMRAIERSLHFDFSGARAEWQKALAQMRADFKEAKENSQKLEEGGLFPKSDQNKPPVDRDNTNGGGSASGAGVEDENRRKESLEASIAKLEEEHAAQQRTDQEQLNALNAKSTDLYYAQAEASGDINKQLEARKAYLENQKEIDQLTAKISKDQVDYDDQINKKKQQAEATAEHDLAIAQESNKELTLRLQGQDDLAEKAKIAFEYDQKIADAVDAIAAAQELGDERAVAMNQALIVQLGLEKAAERAAHDKASAEAAAADAAKRAAEVSKVAGEVGQAKADLGDTQEQTKELQLRKSGQGKQADQLHEAYEWQVKIRNAQADANDAYAKMNDAYNAGNTALGDQYAALAKIKQELVAQLQLQQQISEQDQDQAQTDSAWATGMQNFANNLGKDLQRSFTSPGFQQFLAEEFSPFRVARGQTPSLGIGASVPGNEAIQTATEQLTVLKSINQSLKGTAASGTPAAVLSGMPATNSQVATVLRALIGGGG